MRDEELESLRAELAQMCYLHDRACELLESVLTLDLPDNEDMLYEIEQFLYAQPWEQE